MVVNVSFAEPDPVISIVDPVDMDNLVQTNPTEYFLIALDVADAVDVAGFEVKLTWNKELTEFPPEALEGSFLQDSGIPVQTTFAANFLFSYILVGGYLKAPGGVSGSGTLAYVMFQVKATQAGASEIHIAESKLFNQFGVEYAHTTVDGGFFTTYPYVGFSWTPTAPLPGQVVTFDGSASYDPDTVVGPYEFVYEWNFGDGSPVEYGLTVTHTYAAYMYDPYQVTLTVTDDDGETWFRTIPLRIWRDVGVSACWTSMDEWDNTHFDGYQTQADPYDMYGELWILVSAINYGTKTETFDVTVTVEGYDYDGVYHYFEPYPYQRLNRVLLPGAFAPLWSWWFVLDVSYGAQVWGTNDPVPPGQYTVTASISGGTLAGDQNPSNNAMSNQFGLHGPVEVTNIVRASAGQSVHVYKLKHGPVTFGGFLKNFDNTIGVFRDPITEQGEYARLAIDIYDEAGDLVAHVTSDAVYLNYLEVTADQITATWMDVAIGKYSAVAYAEFGIDGGSFPYWGENAFAFDFAVV